MSDALAEQLVWVRYRWQTCEVRTTLGVPSGYTVRIAKAEDEPAVAAAVLAAYRSDSVWCPLLPGIEPRMTQRIRTTIGATNAAYLIVGDGAGSIVAVSGVARSHWTDQNLLTGICVVPGHQGRGLGRYLLARSLRWLRAMRVEEARVYTLAGSLADRKLYPLYGSAREEGVVYPGLGPHPGPRTP